MIFLHFVTKQSFLLWEILIQWYWEKLYCKLCTLTSIFESNVHFPHVVFPYALVYMGCGKQLLQQGVATVLQFSHRKWYSNTVAFTDFSNPNPWLDEGLSPRKYANGDERKNHTADSSLKKKKDLISLKKMMEGIFLTKIQESISPLIFFFINQL